MKLACRPLSDVKASIPSWDLLTEYAPHDVWKAAFRAAERAPQQRFRMGAALFDRRGNVLAAGCGHIPAHLPSDALSMHAERHALSKVRHLDLDGCSIVVVSLNRNGTGCSWRSCPCAGCARALEDRGVEQVMFPQRLADGGWTVVQESPWDLLARSPQNAGLFARQQRIPVAA